MNIRKTFDSHWCRYGREIRESQYRGSSGTTSMCCCDFDESYPEDKVVIVFKYRPHQLLVDFDIKEADGSEVYKKQEEDDDDSDNDCVIDIERTEKSAKVQAEREGLYREGRRVRVSDCKHALFVMMADFRIAGQIRASPLE